jgi:hypothetical protein
LHGDTIVFKGAFESFDEMYAATEEVVSWTPYGYMYEVHIHIDANSVLEIHDISKKYLYSVRDHFDFM